MNETPVFNITDDATIALVLDEFPGRPGEFWTCGAGPRKPMPMTTTSADIEGDK